MADSLPSGDRTFLTLLEAAPDAMVIVDAQGRMTMVNGQAEKMFGYVRTEMIGQPVEILVPTRSRARHVGHRSTYTHAPGTRPMGVGLDLHGRRKDGSEFPVEISLSPLYVNGAMLTVSAIRDVTDRKQAERERARLIEERAAHAEANRVKDEFIATLSHELRTPLNAILGWTTLLAQGVLDGKESAQALATIARNAKAQAHLIEDLLDISRIMSGKVKLHLQPLDFGEIVEDALAVVRPSADAKGLVVDHVFETRPLLMIGDPDRLQQTVWNLLANAVKFSERGGRIEVRAWQGEEGIYCTVRDTGTGINPEFLPHVFDRFRQADSSYTRPYGGLGLGLAIVRSIVELHGGTVTAASSGEGRGATFRIVLPARARAELHRTQVNQSGSSASVRLDGLRILVVDDQEDERQLLRTILMHRGAEVVTADSPGMAIEQLQDWKPDVIVSDIAMPGEDGYMLLRRVKELPPPASETPAIAVTAHARAEDRDRAIAAGFRAYLPKPIEPARLIRTIAEHTGMPAPERKK
jgi:PAS domain S-box-containing protein